MKLARHAVPILAAALALAALVAPPLASPSEAAYYSFGIHLGYPHYVGAHYRPYHRPHFYGHYRPYPRWGYYGAWAYGPPVVVGGPRMGAVDVDVKPNRTEVYVDGHYVGKVGELDGFPSYLWLEVGEHELTFYQEGFETASRTLTVRPGIVIELDFRLREGVARQPVPAGEPETEPVAASAPAQPEREPPAAPPGERVLDVRGEPARLELRASPTDASVYLDGRFLGTAGELERLHAGLVVDPGSHVLELVRPGYTAERLDLVLDSGEELEVELELEETG